MDRSRFPVQPGIFASLPLIAVYCMAGLAVSMFSLLIVSAAIAFGMVDTSAMNWAAPLCAASGSALAGFLSAARLRRRIVPVGLICGGLFFLILFLIGILFVPGITSGGVVPILLSVFGGSLVGVLPAALGHHRR